MNPVILSALLIAFLIVIVLLCFTIINVRQIRTDKGVGRLVAKSTAPVVADYLDAASAAPSTAPEVVGYLDEGYLGEPTPAPAPAAPVPARAPAPVAAPAPATPTAVPVGVGYMDV